MPIIILLTALLCAALGCEGPALHDRKAQPSFRYGPPATTMVHTPTPPTPARTLSQSLPAGQVAYFMTMAQGSVIADELREGDRLDILALVDGGERGPSCEVLLQNVALLRVLREQGSPPPRTAVLAVTLDEARKLEDVAARGGELRALLRAINDDTIVASRRYDASLLADGELKKMASRGDELRRRVQLFDDGPLSRRLPPQLRAVSMPLRLSEASRNEIAPGDRVALLDGARLLLGMVEVVDTGLPIAGGPIELGLALQPDEAAMLWLVAKRHPPTVVLTAPPAK